MGLSAAQRQHFADHGYLILEDVLTPRDVATLLERVDEYITGARTVEAGRRPLTFQVEPTV